MDSAGLRFVLDATEARSIRGVTRVQSLWGGYGELSRIELEGHPSVILKAVRPPEGEAGLSHLRKSRSYDVECAFYRAYAPLTNERCRVARPIAIDASADRWLLLLEDLDRAGYALRRGRHTRDLEPCIRWLAAFHARFLGVSAPELWEQGTYWHLSTRPDELARTSDRALREAAPIFDRELARARFQTLLHGDAKPANFCFSAEGKVAAVDFQYVGGGCGMKDVAYLLHGSATARETERLLAIYFTALDRPEVEREWRALYPIACADFVRFLAGWSPGSYDDEARAIVERAL